ncbi:MAG: hypothetical protein IPK81_12765 [Rhodospirillales bacterium]|nr:MAG: hypothetical protein IPK81_12765 [Rhodospirillales bacterium]
MGLRLLKAALIALLALVLGYAAAFAIGLVAFEVFAVSQREGANAMGLAFIIAPLVAVICAIVAAVWYLIASGRAPADPTSEAPRGNGRRIGLIVAMALLGWLIGKAVQWLAGGGSFDSSLPALAMWMADWIGAAVLGGTTWFVTRPRSS